MSWTHPPSRAVERGSASTVFPAHAGKMVQPMRACKWQGVTDTQGKQLRGAQFPICRGRSRRAAYVLKVPSGAVRSLPSVTSIATRRSWSSCEVSETAGVNISPASRSAKAKATPDFRIATRCQFPIEEPTTRENLQLNWRGGRTKNVFFWKLGPELLCESLSGLVS